MSNDYTPENTKRERKELEGIFEKSEKLIRIPQKEKKDKEDKMDALTDMIRELMKDIKEVKQDQETYQQELRELRVENETVNEGNKTIKEDMRNMTTRIKRAEKEKIKTNIVVSGLEINIENEVDLKMESLWAQKYKLIRLRKEQKFGKLN
ncbi:hypothetical protein ILUMI_23217 [Ignelater luminosus]|uniref:Uncharacterized protein n=1 Tax=Ignelater luminosus TaxID=2038154 RepID=A0A8K0G245_IGNLU|nr:hypothetical protein ILUMI_23217 [Ignelater luminosus]